VLIDRDNKIGAIFGGDLSWDEPVPLAEDSVLGDTMFGELEFQWLSVCWKVATGGVLQRSPSDLIGALKQVVRGLAEQN
jgi:hypothetical protein